jgi:hypothetical protein
MLAPCPAAVQFVSVIQTDTELTLKLSVTADVTDALTLVIEDGVANKRSRPVNLLNSQPMLVSKDAWNVSSEGNANHGDHLKQ